MEEVDRYISEIKESSKLSDEQSKLLRETVLDLAHLLSQAAVTPNDSEILSDIEFCKITIESLGVVSFNKVAEKARDIAKELFIKGLSLALSSL